MRVSGTPSARAKCGWPMHHLVNANQFTEARVEFTRLTGDFPHNAEVSFAAGLLSLQMGDVGVAHDLLTQTLEYNPRDTDMVHYYLGQVAEQMKQPEAANAHYAEVKSGNYLVSARARQAALLARGENWMKRVRCWRSRAAKTTHKRALIRSMLNFCAIARNTQRLSRC
jgi:predicted Zn-dependent protease